MQGYSEWVRIHTFDDDGVDFDDTKFESSNVLVGVRESGLNLGSIGVINQRPTRNETEGKRIQTYMSSSVSGWRIVLST